MSVQQLLTTLSAVIMTAVSVVTYAYEKFETKESSRDRMERIEARLERIENKLDRFMERKGH
jgi:uncharacterized protein Yka (UPF0111/DUF47 family)